MRQMERYRLDKHQGQRFPLQLASQGVIFLTFGLFFLGSFIVTQLLKSRQETSFKVILSWYFLMFRIWLLVSSIAFFLAGKLLFQPINQTVYYIANLVFGYLFLGLFAVIELFTWLLKRIIKRKQIEAN